MVTRRRRGYLPTAEGRARWDGAFSGAQLTVAKLCRKAGVDLAEKSVRRFMQGQPIELVQILAVFGALDLEAAEGVDFERAQPLIVPEAPPRQVGGYIRRSELENELLGRIGFQFEKQNPERGQLISLEGEGGTGKTRLAVEILRRATARSIDAHFVSFAHLPLDATGEERLVSAFADLLARSLHGWAISDPIDATLQLLRPARKLLVLDNLETVTCPAVTAFLRECVEQCPGVVILATSRLPVGADPAQTFNLEDGMAPSEAISLLHARMAELLPSEAPARRLTPQTARKLVKLCSHLPLAIENVAAMARTPLQPERVLEELTALAAGRPDEKNITAHFRNPSFEGRNRSMRATSLWGYRLIQRWGDEDADLIQRAFRACGIFAGPFRTEDFEAVVGPELSPLLTDLQSAHFLSLDPETGYWTQHVFRRAFSRQLLEEAGELEALEARYREHFLALLQREGERVGLPHGDQELLARLEPNWVRACYLLAERIEAGDIAAVRQFEMMCFAMQSSQYYLGWDAAPLFDRVLTSARRDGHVRCEADCLRGLGLVYLCQRSSRQTAETYYRQALSKFRACGQLEGVADSLRVLADCIPREFLDERLNLLLEALAVVPAEAPFQRALIERSLGVLLLPDEFGVRYTYSAREKLVELGRLADVADCDKTLADVHHRRGEYREAYRIHWEARENAKQSHEYRVQVELRLQGIGWHFREIARGMSPRLTTRDVRMDLDVARQLSGSLLIPHQAAFMRWFEILLMLEEGHSSEAESDLQRIIVQFERDLVEKYGPEARFEFEAVRFHIA